MFGAAVSLPDPVNVPPVSVDVSPVLESLNGVVGIWWIAPVCAIVALLSATLCYFLMKRAGTGNERMEEIAGYVRDGAMAYLRQQYSRVGIVFAILFVIDRKRHV